MEISKISTNPSFQAKFVNNKAFKDVVNYAEKSGQLNKLDTALYKLSKADRGNIIILQGKIENALVPFFSNFTLYKDGFRGYRDRNAVQNLINGASTPEEASFKSILELAEFGKKYKKLFNVKEPKIYGTADDIFEKYTVSKNV